MEKPRRKTERFIIRIFLAGFAVLALLAAATAAGFHFVRQWQNHRLVERAEGFLRAGDARSATLTAQRVLQSDSSNPAACRTIARAAELGGDRAAVEWQQRVVAALPDSIEDQIALAKMALQFQETGIAETALRRVEARAAGKPGFHDALAQLAVAKKDPKKAELQYAEAARLDPDSKPYQLNLAVFHLQSSDPDVRLAASRFLQTLLEDKTIRVPAARALLDYAVQRRDPAVVQIVELLREFPEATFRDRIKCAQLFQVLHLPEFSAALTELQAEAATDAGKTTDLLSWMGSSNLALLAIDWAKSLPSQLKEKRPVFVAVADCYIALSDWAGLLEWCQNGNWGDLEFLRHAYLTHAFRQQGNSLDADLEWSRAVKGASDAERVYALVRDAEKWGWKKEAADLLWSLERDPQKQRAALAALHQYYSELGDTGNLLRVAARMAQIAPEDAIAENNFAQLSLLLNANRERAEETARRLYKREEASPIFASTYAFALYLRGKSGEALKIMDRLPSEDLEQPSVAAYYGLFLAARGEKARAHTFLQIGRTARLLPEEKTLLDNAEPASR